MIQVSYFERKRKDGRKELHVQEFNGEETILKIFPELNDEEMSFDELIPLEEDEFLDKCLEEGVFK